MYMKEFFLLGTEESHVKFEVGKPTNLLSNYIKIGLELIKKDQQKQIKFLLGTGF